MTAVVDICATIITNDDRFCSNFGIEMRRRWPIVNSGTLSVMLNLLEGLKPFPELLKPFPDLKLIGKTFPASSKTFPSR